METIACVLVSGAVRELRLDWSAAERLWDPARPIRPLVRLDLPSILSHLHAALLRDGRSPQLARLVVSGTGLQTRQFAAQSSYANTNFILNSYRETQPYLTFPPALSASALPGFSYQTQPYSEDLFLTLCDVFSLGDNSFAKLTEIQFGVELSSRSLATQDRHGRPVSVVLFANLGRSCPNLRVLDLSNAVSLPTESFIHLFFRDTHRALHRFGWQPAWREEEGGGVVAGPGPPWLHTEAPDCPYCPDPWRDYRPRPVLAPVPVLDDRLYRQLEQLEDAPRYLTRAVRASQLVAAAREPLLERARPPGPAPEYRGQAVEPARYRAAPAPPATNPLCSSLQVLRLGHLGPRYEIVPFLLAALPAVRTLGAINVLAGLKMIRDIPALAAQGETGLRDITIDIVNREAGHNKLTAGGWAHPDIRPRVEQFYDSLDTPVSSVEGKRLLVCQELELVGRHCPSLTSISLFLFLEDFPGLLGGADCGWVWAGLSRLPRLTSLTVICHVWEEVGGLLGVVGARLTKLCLSLDGRGGPGQQTRVPALDTLLAECPGLTTLKVDLRTAALALSPAPAPSLDLTRLTKLSVGLYLTRPAFEWVVGGAVRLEELLVPSVTEAETVQAGLGQQVYYTPAMLQILFATNPLKHIRKFNVHLCLASIEAGFQLVSNLRRPGQLEELSKLTIRVQLPHTHYDNQEELLNDVAGLMQQMRRFKLECEAEQGLQGSGTRIKWSWEKVGLFQSFAEIEQLNAMVEPHNII